MISKNEWLQWKQNPITNRLIELLSVGREVAVEELIAHKGVVGDYQRGAIANFNETLDIIKQGEGLYD